MYFKFLFYILYFLVYILKARITQLKYFNHFKVLETHDKLPSNSCSSLYSSQWYTRTAHVPGFPA